MEILLVKLIKEYIKYSDFFTKVLLKELNIKGDILPYVRKNSSNKNGVIMSYNNEIIKYRFHGVGCYFESFNCKIDIDFGPNSRSDGFDLRRLHFFAANFDGKYIKYKDFKNLEADFGKLINSGVIFCPNWDPSTHLYYLKSVMVGNSID